VTGTIQAANTIKLLKIRRISSLLKSYAISEIDPLPFQQFFCFVVEINALNDKVTQSKSIGGWHLHLRNGAL